MIFLTSFSFLCIFSRRQSLFHFSLCILFPSLSLPVTFPDHPSVAHKAHCHWVFPIPYCPPAQRSPSVFNELCVCGSQPEAFHHWPVGICFSLPSRVFLLPFIFFPLDCKPPFSFRLKIKWKWRCFGVPCSKASLEALNESFYLLTALVATGGIALQTEHFYHQASLFSIAHFSTD